MRTLLAALLLTMLAMPSVYGQANSGPPPRLLPRAAASETPAPAKPAQKRSFLQRLFGPKATPTPSPTPSPATAVKHRPKSRPKPESEETKKAHDEAKKEQEEKRKESEEKVTAKGRPAEPEPAATAKSKTGKGSTKKAAAKSTDTAALDDGTKFKNAKAKALEDEHVKELKSKADGEVDEAAAHKALMNYNRALFEKIREVDPSVSGYAGRVEKALDKRLSSEKGKE